MRRGILYIVLIGACVYIGIINKEKSYFFAAVIMTAVMLSLIAGLIVRYIRTSVKMQMNIPVVEKNSTFCPELAVSATGGQVPHVAAVFSVLAPGMKKKKKSTFEQIDDRYGKCVGKMKLNVSGRYEIKASGVRIYDAFHIFSIRKKVGGTAYIYVLPQCYLVPVEVTKNTRDFVTDSDVYYSDVRSDDSTEVYQVREYRPGDRMTRIHWKLSARQDEIMVRDTSKALSCPVIICMDLDGRNCRHYGQAMSVALESMVSVSFSLIDVKVPHFIAWYDPEEMSITRYRIVREEDVYDAAARLSYVDSRTNDSYDVIGMYRERYRGEDFTSFIDIDMNGNIECGDESFQVGFETIKEDLAKSYITV